METKETKTTGRRCCRKGLKTYPGTQTDVADSEKVTQAEVKQEVSIENNNPRNNS